MQNRISLHFLTDIIHGGFESIGMNSLNYVQIYDFAVFYLCIPFSTCPCVQL